MRKTNNMILLTPFVDGPIGGSQLNATLFTAVIIFALSMACMFIQRHLPFYWDNFTDVSKWKNVRNPQKKASAMEALLAYHNIALLEQDKKGELTEYTSRHTIDWIRNLGIYREFCWRHSVDCSGKFICEMQEIYKIFSRAEDKYNLKYSELDHYLKKNVSPYLSPEMYREMHIQLNHAAYGYN